MVSPMGFPVLLNALPVTDVSEVVGMFACRRLVLLTEASGIVRTTRNIYQLQRASEQFVQSSSLSEALEIWKYSTRNRLP